MMLAGYLAMTITLLLWSGFFLSLRGGALSLLTPADIALTRFALPALILFPWVWKHRSTLIAVPKQYLLGMHIGCGIPYLLVASFGMENAPVADGSALIPGTLPLFVSAIAVLFFKQPLSAHRIIGLIILSLGITGFLFNSFNQYQPTLFHGHLFFLLGSIMWATFTICARVANLNALVSAGFISICSTVTLILLVGLDVLPSYLFSQPLSNWPYSELAVHTLVQGFGAGIIAAYTYLKAVTVLGAERSAVFGSATPALATLMAMFIFDEHPSAGILLSLGLVCIGSLIASNIFMKNDDSLLYQPPKHN